MGKDGFLTPKAIANRIKAKGLQKLRWYCQMCEKQCRDENGFKCHQTSDSHLRQMALFRENSDSYMKNYSKEFETSFMDILRRKGNQRVLANTLYQEVVADRSHIHMNSTIWETLGGFVQYLGKTGKATVDHTEKGWYVRYINRDPELIARQEAVAKRQAAALTEEERTNLMIERQIEMAQAAVAEAGLEPAEQHQPAELKRDSDEPVVKISLAAAPVKAKKEHKDLDALMGTAESADGPEEKREAVKLSLGPAKRKNTALEEIIAENEAKKRKAAEAERRKREEDRERGSEAKAKAAEGPSKAAEGPWLVEDIVVKVMNSDLGGGKYFKQKARVRRVVDGFTAEVAVLQNGHVLQLDQDELETVIPAIGKRVRVLKGAHAGAVAELTGLDQDTLLATVRLVEGAAKGQTVGGLSLDSIAKVHE